jgi:hypothetical protein
MVNVSVSITSEHILVYTGSPRRRILSMSRSDHDRIAAAVNVLRVYNRKAAASKIAGAAR